MPKRKRDKKEKSKRKKKKRKKCKDHEKIEKIKEVITNLEEKILSLPLILSIVYSEIFEFFPDKEYNEEELLKELKNLYPMFF
jgi:hypothetical protein